MHRVYIRLLCTCFDRCGTFFKTKHSLFFAHKKCFSILRCWSARQLPWSISCGKKQFQIVDVFLKSTLMIHLCWGHLLLCFNLILFGSLLLLVMLHFYAWIGFENLMCYILFLAILIKRISNVLLLIKSENQRNF